MYPLSKRQSKIVKELMHLDDYINIKELSEKFSVSSRTIRYDLDKISYWLKENNMDLIRKPNKGIKIESNLEAKNLEKKLRGLNPYNRILSKEERQKIIFLKLYNEEKVKIEDIAKELLISKKTCSGDIKNLEKNLEKYSITIEYKNKKGLYLKGNENAIRKIIVNIINEVLNTNYLLEFIGEKTKYQLKIISYLSENLKIIDFEDIKIIFKILDEAMKYMDINLADDAYASLAIHILIAIKRMSKKNKMEIDESKIKYLKNKKEYLIGTYISRRIEETFKIDFNENEIANIALHLMGSKLYKEVENLDSIESENLEIEKEIFKINDEMIEIAEKCMGLNLKEDSQFKNALLLHLKPAVYRLKNNMRIDNPLLEEMKLRYPFVYQVAYKCSKVMEDYLKIEIPESEIGYIAMHLGAVFEKKHSSFQFVKCLVVCTSGIGTSQLLSIRLKKLLPELQIVGVCSIKDIDRYIDKVQFIISTVDFKNDKVPILKVSPFLNESDLKIIRSQILKVSQINKFMYFNKNDNIVKFNKNSNKKYDKELDPMLKDILNLDNIELNVKATDWKDCIRRAGGLLVDTAMVTKNYVEAMVEAVEKYGPYIVIMPGVAFAHARPCEDVKKPCMSLITLEKPIEFNCGEKDPVSIVFAFGSVNQNGHLSALQDLARFLEKDENIEFITNSKDKELVLKNIIKYEEQIKE
ncbi:BglG family transcription antiterminator [Clostridium oceanicum]|uniref:BglG family transcription antiterminator n=1 Tax=Clostridium oceanicum TaxID=1543 RepID=A0ABN1JM00_9CLOT